MLDRIWTYRQAAAPRYGSAPSVARGTLKRDRGAKGDATTAHDLLGAPASRCRGRIFLEKTLLLPTQVGYRVSVPAYPACLLPSPIRLLGQGVFFLDNGFPGFGQFGVERSKVLLVHRDVIL